MIKYEFATEDAFNARRVQVLLVFEEQQERGLLCCPWPEKGEGMGVSVREGQAGQGLLGACFLSVPTIPLYMDFVHFARMGPNWTLNVL